MSDFKAKLHQIRFRLMRRPRPRRGSLQRSPDLLAGFKGLTSKVLRGGKGGEGNGDREGKVEIRIKKRGGRGKREGKGGKGKER